MTTTAPPSLGRTIAGGLGASALVLAANQAWHALGLTDFDLPDILGRTFVPPQGDGRKPAGVAWYFATGGLLVPALYWLGFRALGRASGARGAAFGVVHYVLSGLLLAATDPSAPQKPRGEGRPMGGFLSRYGALEQASNLLGHVVYGALVGAAARR